MNQNKLYHSRSKISLLLHQEQISWWFLDFKKALTFIEIIDIYVLDRCSTLGGEPEDACMHEVSVCYY